MLRELEKQSDQSAQILLFEACRELDYEKAFLAIKKGANVNVMASFTPGDTCIYSKKDLKFSPLGLVAMHGKTKLFTTDESDRKACKIATLLLKNDAELDTLDSGDMGNSPLHWAIVTYKKNLCKLFIQIASICQKKVINLHNQPAIPQYGTNTPLLLALRVFSQSLVHNTLDLEISELLIAAGADVNALDYHQQSALHWAAILRLPESFFNLLIDNHANYFPNKYGKTPKALYETTLQESMVDPSMPPSSCRDLGFHLVDWSEGAGKCHHYTERALGNRNSSYQPEVSEMLNMFEITLSSEEDHIDSKELDYKPEDVDLLNPEIVEPEDKDVLVKTKHDDIPITAFFKPELIHLQSERITIGDVCLTIKNSQTSDYELSVTQSRMEKHEYRLSLEKEEARAIVDAIKISTDFLIDILEKMGSPGIQLAELLKTQVILKTSLLGSAVKTCNIENIDIYINDKTLINAQDADGFTALHWAAMRRHEGLISRLLGHGADPSIKNKYDRTPVDYYVYQIRAADFKEFADKTEYKMLQDCLEGGDTFMPEFNEVFDSFMRKHLVAHVRNSKSINKEQFNINEEILEEVSKEKGPCLM